LLFGAWAYPARARWEGPADNKSEAELAQLDLKALFNEGFDVCVRRAVLSSGAKADEVPDPAIAAAGDYLSIIEAHVRDKNQGRLPDWMRALSFARTTKECQRVFRAFVSGELAPETRPAQAVPTAVATRPRATPVPTRTKAVAPPTVPRPTASATAIRPREVKPQSSPTRTAPPTKSPRPTRPLATATSIRIASPTFSPRSTAPASLPTKPTARSRPKESGEITDELPPWLRPPER
jgi:hypothetical protein